MAAPARRSLLFRSSPACLSNDILVESLEEAYTATKDTCSDERWVALLAPDLLPPTRSVRVSVPLSTPELASR